MVVSAVLNRIESTRHHDWMDLCRRFFNPVRAINNHNVVIDDLDGRDDLQFMMGLEFDVALLVALDDPKNCGNA